ncbi:Hemolysin-activating lysine-acyltransferase HlyC [Pseudovibrio sp. Ad13]|uniref:toxin-activating lysine-acyltransferase n=1 Tax=Pseudovibrio sp. Ad13 TaxID=989396 RepID=UPI0007AECDBA|nr:toxin-activating lysine-acyltransferase [Pseudovibrio sp. Ad13]KZK84049.1 Hemolysin-activating lysine-acyltransferase HlyC [Pseudovibrio sp. Ad13]
MSEKKADLSAVDAQTFASTMGQAVWLMTMSEAHKDLPIRIVEERIAPALLLRQFKLYSKGNQPVAFLVWASVSDEVKERIENGEKKLDVKEWRSGNNIVILDCVSPFNPATVFEQKFLSELKK